MLAVLPKLVPKKYSDWRERRDDCMSWLHFPIKAHSNDYHFMGTLCCLLIIIIKGILYVGIGSIIIRMK